MKHILFGVVGTGALMIISLSSCKKSDMYPVITASQTQPHFLQSGSVELVANNWVNYGGPIYVNTFKDLIAPVDGSGSRQVKIYLNENGRLTELGHGHINYMGNDLWAASTQVDVAIMYSCKGRLPFTDLRIKVEVDREKFR